jgi:hypothetical protein
MDVVLVALKKYLFKILSSVKNLGILKVGKTKLDYEG